MSSAQDPFYIVKEEIQESIDKLLSTFRQWEHLISNGGEQEDLGKELLASCESIEWQVEELDKTISVAARDPAFYGISEIELVKRRKWTRTARDQVNTVRKAVSDGKGPSIQGATAANGMHRELMKLTVDYSHQINGSSQYNQANDDFISSESDRQLLLMRQQDEDLDELSASVQRIGHVGLTIHDELLGQEKIIDELGMELDSTSNRLEFLQKKVAVVMKKAGAKGQIMMILFLVVLFLILFFLVFFA
ncbi:Syntaxin-61 [Dionaea muscipula]